MADTHTISVPAAGATYFGTCRTASYTAAKRGDIPTVKMGKLLRVPIRSLEAMLDAAAAVKPADADQRLERVAA
jgi:hypothetical protein